VIFARWLIAGLPTQRAHAAAWRLRDREPGPRDRVVHGIDVGVAAIPGVDEILEVLERLEERGLDRRGRRRRAARVDLARRRVGRGWIRIHLVRAPAREHVLADVGGVLFEGVGDERHVQHGDRELLLGVGAGVVLGDPVDRALVTADGFHVGFLCGPGSSRRRP
jgi:hypothetical protein